ncbi:hypothetical protein HGRIS_000153 [Hohenbuehelia grisea]|uniref:Uncharacterized protein n=1 Tax=Hohenbuehelia grisea TaxID=104357 RepID=A0ABR3JQD3_9AGAR
MQPRYETWEMSTSRIVKTSMVALHRRRLQRNKFDAPPRVHPAPAIQSASTSYQNTCPIGGVCGGAPLPASPDRMFSPQVGRTSQQSCVRSSTCGPFAPECRTRAPRLAGCPDPDGAKTAHGRTKCCSGIVHYTQTNA